ncbi:MAG TPA: biotin--[acetyl-CoA-carboxylase] ligase [Bacteriovoracaceae bacterium]|nr:biotin--[acetyl-CoA-carboxylase] ligase [Bacteriovoracaceae bacterium]
MIEHIHLQDCHSTQDILKEQLQDPLTVRHVLVSCEKQTSGRGRGDSTWTSMPGTLCFSLGLAPNPELSFTALEISVLIARFFEAKSKNLKLKWPNDLWNDENKKCCGILVQIQSSYALVGVGLNLFSESPEFGGVYPGGFEFDKKLWARDLGNFILTHRYFGKMDLKRDWEERCLHLNHKVRITEGTEVSEGLFQGLGTHGEALLANGEKVTRLYNGSLVPLG